MKYGGDYFMPVGIPIIGMSQIFMNIFLNKLFNILFFLSVIIAFQIYVVKSFYDFEVEFSATSERNVVVQPTLGGPAYLALPSQTIQNPTYPVQPGPYVIQQVQQPITQPPYLQETHQYQPLQQPQSHMVLPMQDQHAPHEYTNPPPYSPNYTMQCGPSVKQ